MGTGVRSQLFAAGLAVGLILAQAAHAQDATYDQLVAQAQADLNAGRASKALAESQKAIGMDGARWEAYVVAGGALQTEHNYAKAVEDFKQALAHAPDAKKAAVKGLLEKCVKEQVAAQSRPSPAPSRQAAQPQSENKVSQAEVVLWKTIENSNNASDFHAYLQQYPNGAFVALARQGLQQVQNRYDGLNKLAGAWKGFRRDIGLGEPPVWKVSDVSWLHIAVDATTPSVTFQEKSVEQTYVLDNQWHGVDGNSEYRAQWDGSAFSIAWRRGAKNTGGGTYRLNESGHLIALIISDGPLPPVDYVRSAPDTLLAEKERASSIYSELKGYFPYPPMNEGFAPCGYEFTGDNVAGPTDDVEVAFGVDPITISGRAGRIGAASVTFKSEAEARRLADLIARLAEVCTAGLK